MHASIPTTHVSLIFSIFLFCSTSSYFVPSVPLYCPQLPLLYYLPWWDLPFLPLNCFWLLIGVLSRLPTGLSAAQPLPLLWMCWLHHSLFPDKISCFVSYFSLFFHFSHLDKDQAFPLPISMGCIKWSRPTFTSFGWYSIPAGHPSLKKFEREPQNRPPLSPHS